MRIPPAALLILSLLLPALVPAAVFEGCEGRPDPVRARAAVPGAGDELFRIRVVNRIFGAVSVSSDRGRSWSRIGRVLVPDRGKAHAVGDREFTASDWAPVGAVAATAVNAIHLKLDQLDPHALVVSLLPRELAEVGPTGSYRDAEASIVLDLPAGTGIFGAELALRVGDPLFREDMLSGALEPWDPARAPALGDRLVMVAARSPHTGGVLEIENRAGGSATWTDAAGRSRVVGTTLRRVSGCGRFGGTVYQEVGRVRANHPGVLCVSTSPRGVSGGFQVVPCHHASDPVLSYVKSTPAYLVLGEVPGGPGLEGTPPIFRGAFRPGDRVEFRIGGRWREPPPAEGRVDDALDAVEAIRFHAAP